MKNITNTLQNSQQINISELLEDYQLDFGEFTDLDERLLDIEDEWNELTIPEKTVLILYAEYGSLRKVATLLGFSHSTVAKYINGIREKLC